MTNIALSCQVAEIHSSVTQLQASVTPADIMQVRWTVTDTGLQCLQAIFALRSGFHPDSTSWNREIVNRGIHLQSISDRRD